MNSLFNFIKYKEEYPFDVSFKELGARLNAFVNSNEDLLREFQQESKKTFHSDKFTSVIKATMPDDVKKLCDNYLFSIVNYPGDYFMGVYMASKQDCDLYEYSHDRSLSPDELDLHRLSVEYPDCDGWENDEETSRGRRRFQDSFMKTAKTLKDWMPIVEAKLKETFPDNSVLVEYSHYETFGVEISIV
jgi:hypothetical protein